MLIIHSWICPILIFELYFWLLLSNLISFWIRIKINSNPERIDPNQFKVLTIGKKYDKKPHWYRYQVPYLTRDNFLCTSIYA